MSNTLILATEKVENTPTTHTHTHTPIRAKVFEIIDKERRSFPLNENIWIIYSAWQ